MSSGLFLLSREFVVLKFVSIFILDVELCVFSVLFDFVLFKLVGNVLLVLVLVLVFDVLELVLFEYLGVNPTFTISISPFPNLYFQ